MMQHLKHDGWVVVVFFAAPILSCLFLFQQSVWILNFYLGIAGSAASTIQSFAFAPANVVMGWIGNEKYFNFQMGGVK